MGNAKICPVCRRELWQCEGHGEDHIANAQGRKFPVYISDGADLMVRVEQVNGDFLVEYGDKYDADRAWKLCADGVLQLMANKPRQACPVCGGRRSVPQGFYYDKPPGFQMFGQLATVEPCRTCGGAGII